MELSQLGMRLKENWDLPRALQWTNWGLIFSMALLTGFLAATGLEAFLNVPPTSVRPLPVSAQPKRAVSLPFEEFQASIEHNLFGVEVGSDEPQTAPEQPQTPQGDLAAWINRLELAGVYEGKKQRAIVTEKSTGKQGLFAAGDQIFEGPVFQRIGGNLKEPKILLAMGGKEAWLELVKGPATPVQTAPPPRRSQAPRAARGAAPAKADSYSKNGKDFYITSAEVDAQLNNLPTLLNQARVVPYFQDGKHAGYIIKAIDRGSLYEKLGLRNQDVIKRINGETIDSPEEAFSLLKMLRNEREITLNIERKKAPKTLVYHIN